MKKYILLSIATLASCYTATYAQQDTVITTTTVTKTTTVGDTTITSTTNKETSIEISDLNVGKKDNNEKDVKYPRVYGGITFTRIDWGFSRLLDNGSFNLSEGNENLSYSRASNFGFDVAQIGVRTSDNFKIYTAAGFEWNYLRLKNNVLLEQGAQSLTFSPLPEGNYRKNVLTSTYLRIPVGFEWRSPKTRGGERVKIAAGPMFGILLKGTQRLRSNEYGKQKYRDNYNLQSFQYGGFLRVGFGDIGVFAKYYANDMFENSPAQEGLNNFTFGLTLGF